MNSFNMGGDGPYKPPSDPIPYIYQFMVVNYGDIAYSLDLGYFEIWVDAHKSTEFTETLFPSQLDEIRRHFKEAKVLEWEIKRLV